MSHRIMTSSKIIGAVLVAIVCTVPASATEMRDVKCWEAALYDLDGDGYADYNAHKDDRVTRTVPYAERLTCDTGWVAARGDTDDFNPNVHPRRREVANGIDDNCDGRVDEPTFFYSVSGYSNTTSGYTMRVRINDLRVVDAYKTPGVSVLYRIEYQELRNTLRTVVRPLRTLTGMIEKPGSYGRADIRLDGLEPGLVYRARVRFYVRGFSNKAKPVGPESPWYYTLTDSNSAVGHARTRIVLRGFYEHYLSEQTGRTGYLGSEPDGTRYSAVRGEYWCSEFYSWVTDHELDGMGHREGYKDLIQYFMMGGSFDYIDNPFMLRALSPGDYMAVATGSDPDKITHSAMFLAYDALLDEVWTLDGNTNGYSDIGDSYANRRATNETFVRHRDQDTMIGAGVIVPTLLR